MLELIKKRKRNWLGHWQRRNCLLKDALKGMVNGKKVRRRRIYQMIDNIMVNELYEDTKRKAAKRVEWRMRILPLDRTLCIFPSCNLNPFFPTLVGWEKL